LSRDRDRNNNRTSLLDDARNELFSHIHRCGVLRATPEQQAEWMKDTVEFLAERFSGLSDEELNGLEAIGMRFCSPVIVNGATAESADAGETAESATEADEALAEAEAEPVGV
jgi:hypothetical protein